MQGKVTTMADDNDKVTNTSKQVVVKQQPDLLAVVVVVVDDDVDATKKPPAAAGSPPVTAAVMPADNKTTTTTITPPPPPAAELPILLVMVYLWALANAVGFAVADIATLILNRTPCTKSTWLFPCVEIPDAAAAELTALTYAQLLAAALALAAATATTRTTTSRMRWPAAVGWVALAATAAVHCMEVASDRIVLAAAAELNAGDKKFVLADLVFGCVGLAVDLLLGAAVLLVHRRRCCCSPSPRRRMGLELELVGDDDGEV